MDSLVALGSAASAIYSLVALFVYSAHTLYFESAGMILTLITLGKFLETKSKGKTKEAVNKLIDLTPELQEKREECAELRAKLEQQTARRA